MIRRLYFRILHALGYPDSFRLDSGRVVLIDGNEFIITSFVNTDKDLTIYFEPFEIWYRRATGQR